MAWDIRYLPKYDQCEKVGKDSVNNMNNDVDDVIACGIISSKIIIKGKTDIGHGTVRASALKPCIVQFNKIEIG